MEKLHIYLIRLFHSKKRTYEALLPPNQLIIYIYIALVFLFCVISRDRNGPYFTNPPEVDAELFSKSNFVSNMLPFYYQMTKGVLNLLINKNMLTGCLADLVLRACDS